MTKLDYRQVKPTFESLSKNLLAYPCTIGYMDGRVSSIVYAAPNGEIIKTVNYIDNKITSIVISGETLSEPITKTIIYTGDSISSITYS